MVKTTPLLVFFLGCAALTSAALQDSPLGPTNRFRLMRHGPPPPPPGGIPQEITQYWITQKLDHFSPLDDRTWEQRYYVADNYFQPGGPVLVFLGGEWESIGAYLTNGLMATLAKQTNALTIDLEHRYYGQSRPTQNITSENLRYLSSDQSLADLAYFATSFKESSDFDLSSSKWILFGGSYSANLAAWGRAKYPHLFHAAHASSGPVLAQMDFPEYFEVVDEALRDADEHCPSYVGLAMKQLQSLVAAGGTENANKIGALFNLCEASLDLDSEDDVQNLYTSIASYFAGSVQYAAPGQLSALCEELGQDVTAPLETMAGMVRESYAGACLTSRYQDILDYYRDQTSYTDDISRQWFYQTCTEYGYYQSLSSKNQPFGQVVPVEYYLKWCSEVYGPEFTREVAEAGVARTNLVNGGLTPDVTRVLYTHGSLDPWHALGIQTDLHSEAPAIVITGASHCVDLRPAASNDWQDLTDARTRALEILTSWLEN